MVPTSLREHLAKRGRAEDLTGRRFGRLVVLSRDTAKSKNSRWLCRCDCGVERSILRTGLMSGRTVSCGCRMLETLRPNRTHGKSHTSTWITWASMKSRCNNPNNNSYADYGGRGIKVCGRWSVFEHFLADMDERPDGKSIDRIDNDGDYEPSNCRWATNAEQQMNKRPPKYRPHRQRKLVGGTLQRAIDLFASGLSKRQIGKALKVSSQTVMRALRRELAVVG